MLNPVKEQEEGFWAKKGMLSNKTLGLQLRALYDSEPTNADNGG